MLDKRKELTQDLRESLVNKLIRLRGEEKILLNELFNNKNNTLSIEIKIYLLSEQIEKIKEILINNKF